MVIPWLRSAAIVCGFLTAAQHAMPQAGVISARPGGINYIEGSAFLNDRPIASDTVGRTFLHPNDTLSTDLGKVEVLLTPGVFLRIGDNSQIRMTSNSLIDVQLQLNRGEAMIDVDELVKENKIQIVDHGGSIVIEKPGLYRIMADDPPTAAVITGKIDVYFEDKKVTVGKGHQAVIAENLPEQKFDSRKEDELYAWSNVRSEYDAAASLQSARSLTANNVYGPLGVGGGYGPGWFWNDMFDSWAWLPGGDLGFFSPFGYGFFGPGAVGYAPICYAPVNGRRWGHWHGHGNWVPVAVNPQHPPTARPTSSPWQNRNARASVARSFAGFQTVGGGFIPAGTRMFGPSILGASGNRGHVWSGTGGHVGTWARANGGSPWSGGGGHFSSGAGHFGADGGGHFSGGGGHCRRWRRWGTRRRRWRWAQVTFVALALRQTPQSQQPESTKARSGTFHPPLCASPTRQSQPSRLTPLTT